MKRVVFMAIAFYLAACATEAGYREIVESWIGAREADLVASVWGPPQRVYEVAGGTRIPVVHTVELLDWATGGPEPQALTRNAD